MEAVVDTEFLSKVEVFDLEKATQVQDLQEEDQLECYGHTVIAELNAEEEDVSAVVGHHYACYMLTICRSGSGKNRSQIYWSPGSS